MGGGYSLVAPGIGGTGVVTLNQVIATAGFLEGLHVTGLDQTGLSQKAGPVVSHLRLWRTVAEATDAPAASNAVGPEGADLMLALDALVATDPKYIVRASADRTVTVASTSLVPTADMIRGAVGAPTMAPLLDALAERTRPGRLVTLDTVGLAMALFDETMPANLIALGAAYQAGGLPLAAASIERAIELNGVAVETNLAAFRAGRLAVSDPDRLPVPRRRGAMDRKAEPAGQASAQALAAARGLAGEADALAVRRAADLIDYQNERLAARYLDLVGAAAAAERQRLGSQGAVTAAVTEAFFHLLAYKDEYEVARLHMLPAFTEALAEAVPGGTRVRYRLHPPVLRALGMERKIAIPAGVARPTFRLLRGMRRLRGTAADPFGYTQVRRMERRIAAEYEADIRAVLEHLSAATHSAATELARLPLSIRGYEEIKVAAVERYEEERARLRPLTTGAGTSDPRTPTF